MQENPKGSPKISRIRRVHNTSIAEVTTKCGPNTISVSRSTIAHNRATLMPNNVRMQKPHKHLKKELTSRHSIMPSQLSLDTQKKVDTESKEIELGLLYDEYLQTMAMDFIMKKKTEEKKHLMIAQLATLAQEIDQDMKKLIKVKKRERDIISLSLAQTEMDAQLAAVVKCTKNETFNTMKDRLSKLHSLLKPLDVLRCDGIILPQTQEEWKETQEVLKMCSNILKDIVDLFGSRGNIYCAVNDGLKDFAETYSDIENLQKKLEETLCNLQVLMLKNASQLLN